MALIGNPIVSTDFPVNYFSGNGSTTAFTLSIAPASVNAIDVQVSGVSQSPQTYSVSGTTLTFSAAPPSGSSNIVVRHLGIAGIPNTPSAASVSYSSLDSSLQNRFDNSNKIINGCMRIDQRNAGASVTLSSSAWTFPVDRFSGYEDTDGVMTAQQVLDAPTGFVNSIKCTTTTADAALAATQRVMLRQTIEGLNIADLAWGSASAATITISFWVKSSLTGTFGGSVQNGGGTRAYPFTYSISSANTWEQKTVTVLGDTTGTWLTTNGVGMQLMFGLGVGTTYSAAANSWTTGEYNSATGATSVIGTNGATWQVTGVDLRKGSYSTAPTFDMRQYGQELALCQRYYEKSYSINTVPGTNTVTGMLQVSGASETSQNLLAYLKLAVDKRTDPTMSFYRHDTGAAGVWAYDRSGASGSGTVNHNVGTSGGRVYVGVGATWTAAQMYGHWVASAEL